jgi:hypothetical protein
VNYYIDCAQLIKLPIVIPIVSYLYHATISQKRKAPEVDSHKGPDPDKKQFRNLPAHSLSRHPVPNQCLWILILVLLNGPLVAGPLVWSLGSYK